MTVLWECDRCGLPVRLEVPVISDTGTLQIDVAAHVAAHYASHERG